MIHALRDLCLRALASGKLPTMAGLPATLLLSTTLEQLERQTGLVSVLNGGTVPVDYVIRMAAEMKIVPMVFTAAGQPLYCGQTERFATLPIRYVTATQDRGCVIPAVTNPSGSAKPTTSKTSPKAAKPPPKTSAGSASTTTNASTAGPGTQRRPGVVHATTLVGPRHRHRD